MRPEFNSDLMYLKLQHIILFLISGCLISSCVSDSPEERGETQGAELQFAAGELTRAVTTNINTEGSKFSLFGEKKFQGEIASHSSIVIFNNTLVTYSGDGWTYGEPEYWFPQHEYSFVAVHPVSVLSKSGADASQYSNSSLSFSYTMPLSESDEVNIPDLADIIVSTHRRMYKESISSSVAPVRLNFFHVMSRVNFQLANEGAADMVRVNKIELEGVNKTGTFSITPASLLSGSVQTDDYDCSWTGLSNIGNVTANLDAEVPKNEEYSLFPDDKALFMIPQPDNNGVIMKISYTLCNANNNDKEVTLTAETPIGGWEPGKIYTYIVSVQKQSITFNFNVEVEDWKYGDEKDVTVPRK